VRRLLALMMTCSLLTGCTGEPSATEAPTTDHPTPAVIPTESSPSVKPAAKISLPHLPPQGFAVEWRHADGGPGARVVLLNLRGEVLARLPGFSIDHVSDRPGAILLRRGHDEYLLEVSRPSLRLVGRRLVDSLTTSEDANVPLGPPPNARPGREVVGHWRWMDLAPNGNEALAQWSGECEFPVAFFVPVQEGRPVPVTGASTLGQSPASIALGWTRRGRMAVMLPTGGCGGATERPGVYRFASPGHGSLIFPIEDSTAVRMWGPSSAPSQP
jgi:hypothetical protein